ncbi:hypothetical protein BDL97_16G055000 [Sphagnum fallax]|jgi:homeobox-leucine zipper protein|nr:hypothetical protein BDL97_16G055000 [Sphagnum fallax]
MTATSAMRSGFGTAQSAGTLMGGKETTSSDSLVAILASCSNMGGIQVGGGLGDHMMTVVGCGDKRPFSSYPGASTFAGSPGEADQGGDEDGGGDFSLHNVEKKRRLTFEQVRSLERNFELENKLEPERKMQLSKELGLQPRQVAVWFQNRRARWKTKQLERDYEVLSVAYNRLKTEFEAIVQEKDRLKCEVHRLSVKTELPACDGVQEPSSVSESEITTTTHTSDNAQVNSSVTTVKTESAVIISEDQQEQHQLVENTTTRDSSQSTRLSPTVAADGSTQKVVDQEPEQSTSADSNSSDILNVTDSPRTVNNCTTTHPPSSSVLVIPTLDQQQQLQTATNNELVAQAESASFVVDSSLLDGVEDDDLCGAAGHVMLSPQAVYQRPPMSIKLEDDCSNSSYPTAADDHSCIYFLSQLDDKTGATPWWDWS